MIKRIPNITDLSIKLLTNFILFDQRLCNLRGLTQDPTS